MAEHYDGPGGAIRRPLDGSAGKSCHQNVKLDTGIQGIHLQFFGLLIVSRIRFNDFDGNLGVVSARLDDHQRMMYFNRLSVVVKRAFIYISETSGCEGMFSPCHITSEIIREYGSTFLAMDLSTARAGCDKTYISRKSHGVSDACL